jgi:ATP-dependent helicase/nuclease subunit A
MNLVFNASAGTGKTWQVTELYSALVTGLPHAHLPGSRRPAAPEKILLMTFTENAAAELRAEVSKKMVALEKDALAADDDERADRARRVLRSLPAAKISTIHAFCAGLLREHALEMGLSPSFRTLEEDVREDLLNETLKAEIFHRLETDRDFREFCAGVQVLGNSDCSVIGTLRSLLEKAASRGLDLSAADAMLPPPQVSVQRADFERIRDELEAFDLPKTAAAALDALNTFLAGFPDLQKLEAVAKFGQAKKVKHLSDELAELKERFLTETLYREQIGTFRAFARALAGAGRRFTEAKRARDGVDFGDQLLLARDLLRQKPFDELPFEWILVDEVQDTSRVQCDVIEALWTAGANLVVCGDRKQSIYAWRSADPDVMPDLEAAMERRGDMKRIALKQSRRSKDRLLDAVNELFAGLIPDYASAALEPVAEIGGVTDGEGPCVEFLMPDNEEQGVEEEMAATARRIRLLAEGGPEWRPAFGYDGGKFSRGEPVRYGDILILLKRSTHQTALENALREEGIPFSSGGTGRALFEQQEVRDLLLLLQVLTEPFNDLALAGFLRTPFAGLTVGELAALGWDGETFGRDILRKRFFESTLPAAERVLRCRAQTGEKPASELIRDMVRETAFDAQLAGQPGGGQKLANFKKALDWIRAAERGGQVLIGDVVRRFEKAIHTPPSGGAAEALLPDPEQNAVTLMTVHGAKGLTRRVCFVPDISFGEPNDQSFAVFSPEGGLEMNIPNLDGGKVRSPGWNAARAADKAVREAERLNVFYVAMTRARDLTVLSGSGTKRPDGWLKLAETFLSDASDEILCRREFSELKEVQHRRPEVRDQKSEVVFRRLKIPKGNERKPVTSLIEHLKPAVQNQTPSTDRRAVGTLGHRILEELAKSRWQGDIAELAERLGGGVKPAASPRLITQLEEARDVLCRETRGAVALFAEHPFVLKRDRLILDGTIDLLVQNDSARWRVMDYKFTNEPADRAQKIYAPQLAAYREAVEQLHPGATVTATLVLIGSSVETVQA